MDSRSAAASSSMDPQLGSTLAVENGLGYLPNGLGHLPGGLGVSGGGENALPSSRNSLRSLLTSSIDFTSNKFQMALRKLYIVKQVEMVPMGMAGLKVKSSGRRLIFGAVEAFVGRGLVGAPRR